MRRHHNDALGGANRVEGEGIGRMTEGLKALNTPVHDRFKGGLEETILEGYQAFADAERAYQTSLKIPGKEEGTINLPAQQETKRLLEPFSKKGNLHWIKARIESRLEDEKKTYERLGAFANGDRSSFRGYPNSSDWDQVGWHPLSAVAYRGASVGLFWGSGIGLASGASALLAKGLGATPKTALGIGIVSGVVNLGIALGF